MDAIAAAGNYQDVALPEWLSECLATCRTDRQPSEAAPSEQPDACQVAEAFDFAYQLHEGQYRKSGEPYIAHPIAVAGLLRELGGDSAMLAAGFLHDIVEDTEVTPEDIEARFGSEVRQLVEGVTKLSKFNFASTTERQAENFRRMFLAMAQDIRVIVVKLADRLHNMRTLEHLPAHKQRSIAQETREIFAPLANRLGIGRVKWELEDLAFKVLEPEQYQRIQALVAERRTDRERRLETVAETLRQRLEGAGINVSELTWRPKHLYGIYRKMQQQQKSFEQIYDIAALRIIVSTKEECYRALAIVHDAFRPIPGRFKDYIGLPKPNQYQSLHTSVIGPTGRPLELQIRTVEMHHVAEYGIAAHWLYKESGGMSNVQASPQEEKFTWLRQLLEWQNDLKDAQEYVEHLKDNLFEDDVYVFTPQGDVVALSRGATPVDFAYHIHTEVGNHMKGARVNGQWSPLDRPLENGDIVEIVTQKNAHPSLDWLNFAVTPSARTRIRQWYKRSHRNENIARGRSMLEKALGKAGFESMLKSEPIQNVVERSNYQSVDDWLAAIGYGEITLESAVNKLREALFEQQPVDDTSEPATETSEESELQAFRSAPTREFRPSDGTESPIEGVEGLTHAIAGCCHPVPGEAILGVVTRKRGITIHRQDCPNAANVPGERLVPVAWKQQNGRAPKYPVEVEIEAIDRVGVFKDILSRLSDRHINVCNAQVKTDSGHPALIHLSIEVRDREQLQRSFDQIKKMSDVLNIRRLSEAERN